MELFSIRIQRTFQLVSTPYYKVGGKLLYKEKDILVLLEKNRVETFDHW